MAKREFKYIYGPVSSWRLGSSLGVDCILSDKGKTCSFDCIYCQIGKTEVLSDKREIFVPAGEIIEEIRSLPPVKIDYVTFSGAGEPTLAKNLGKLIKEIRKIRKEKIAVLTNSSLIGRKDVQGDLVLADFVIAKLDAHSQAPFDEINKPVKGIKFDRIIKGLREFRALLYRKRFALQIMFVKENKDSAGEIARLAKELNPDEIQINTPTRPCGVEPLTKKELDEIKVFFEGTNYISVYDAGRKKVKPVSQMGVLKRRGKP